MVLLIDNYDSFTYNLYDYIMQLGKECLVVRNNEITIEGIAKMNFESIVISPGPGIPENAGITMELIKKFYKQKPLLGICLGHQAIGEFFGAKLIKAKNPIHGKTSTLYFENHDLFFSIENPFEVMRYHSLILEDIKLPLKIIAETKNNEIMSFYHTSLPIVGIQFHPESILTENGLLMMKNFFKIVEKHKN